MVRSQSQPTRVVPSPVQASPVESPPTPIANAIPAPALEVAAASNAESPRSNTLQSTIQTNREAAETSALVGRDRDAVAQYISQVRNLIQAQKRYPRLARKRSLEGEVIARLRIGADGSIDSVELAAGAPSVLIRAARTAIERASPFPTPPPDMPIVELPIQFRLKDSGRL